MGIAMQGDVMAVACHDQIMILKADPKLANSYPTKSYVYDNVYLPRQSYYTGPVDVHDIHYGNDGHLYGVNTLFSTICRFDQIESFTPIWKPSIIDSLKPIDACHLNGLAMKDGRPTYVSALGYSNEPQGWRHQFPSSGVIIDVDSNEIIASDLMMPHTPRWYDDKLYALCSASEQLVTVDLQSGQTTDVCHIPGFVRGMSRIEDYVFVASSKLRKNSSVFRDLSIADRSNQAAITAVHLPTGTKVAHLSYLSSVDEIYDVQIVTDFRRLNILNRTHEPARQSISTRGFSSWPMQRQTDDQHISVITSKKHHLPTN